MAVHLFFSDYRPMPGLDRYDPQMLDDEDYDQLSVTDRRAAEEAMRRRDKEAGILRRDDREIFYDASDDEEVGKTNAAQVVWGLVKRGAVA